MNTLFIREVKILWDKVDKYSYLRHIAALNNVERVEFNSPVTFFVGENGSGKSTLLEAIAVAYGFNPEGGTKNYNFSTYDSHSQLCNAIKLIKGVRLLKWGYYLRAESFYNVATIEGEYRGGKSHRLHEKSHGESFLDIVQSNFQSNGIYILDEPEAALSPQKQLTLLAEIYRCVKGGAQFIIATHSPILLGMPEAEILSFDSGKLHSCKYEETGSYRITEMFINNRKTMLDELLKKD